MKKITAMLMAILFAAAATACSGGNDTPENTSAENSVSENVSTNSSISAGSKKNKKTDRTAAVTKSDSEDKFKQNAVIEETLLYDENDVKITAKELSYDNYEVKLKLMIENNSSKSLSFIAGSLGHSGNSVNGYMYDGGYLNCDVAAGKKAMESISFGYKDLIMCGMYEIADIEIDIEFYDDDYNKIYTGPLQIKTTAYDSYDRTVNFYRDTVSSKNSQSKYGYSLNYFSEDVLYDSNGIRLISEMMFKNSDGDDILMLEFENNSDEIIYASINDIALNSLTVQGGPWTSKTINPGKRRIIDLPLSDMAEENIRDLYGLNEAGEIEFDLVIWNDIYKEAIDSADIKITVSEEKTSFDNSGEEVYNNNGIRIIFKDVLDDSSSYSNDIHIMLLAENNSSKDIYINDEYDSFSVNGFMMDYSFYGENISAGKSAILDIKLWDMSLEDSDISNAEDIKDFEITLKIRDKNYNDIDRQTVSVSL